MVSLVKLLGLSFGRKMQSTEILVKEALMGAEELGAEVGMIRAHDLNIKPCTGCVACMQSLFRGGPGRCAIKDDITFLDEQFMQCDGLILGSPVYVVAPTGLFKTVADRLGGPSHDVGFRMEAKKIWEASGKQGQPPDERSFKPRVGAFISVGGASTPSWLSFGLPLMHLLTFPLSVSIVDQMQITSQSQFGHIAMNDTALERARKMGRRVVETLHQPASNWKWLGDEPGVCPVCHSNLLMLAKRNPVECPVCGIAGELRIDGGEISVTFSEEEQKRSRLGIHAKLEHWIELQDNFKLIEARMRAEGQTLPAGLGRYDSPSLRAKLEKFEGYREIKTGTPSST